MMKVLLHTLLLIVLSCSSAYAQVSRDSLLYNEFRKEFPLANNHSGIESFTQTKKFWGDSKSIDKYKRLISYENIGSEVFGISWDPGFRVKVGSFDVLHYEVLYSSPKRLYGPIWIDYIVSVYTESGELVDKRVVLRWQDGFDGEIKGTAQPYNLNIAYKQSSLEELDIIRTFRRSYIISPLGKIEMSHTVAPQNVLLEIGKAMLWPKGRLTNDTLHKNSLSTSEKRMSASFIEYYMPIHDNVYRWEWNWGLRHSEANYTTLLSNAFAMALGWETSARDLYVLTTIDKQGKVIDQRMLGRNTPQERTLISSDSPNAITIDSYSLSFRDFYTLNDEARHTRTLYRIDSQGRISSETLITDEPISSSQVP